MNIYDIAEKAGVSIATVSRVINGSDKVSDKTRARIMAIIEENNYTPNVFARGLSGDSIHIIGILVPDIADHFMSRAVSYLEKNLHEKGYNILLSCSGYSAEEKESHIRMLLDERIDAMILVGSTYAGSGNESHNTESIKEASCKIPVFLINGYIESENIYCTFSNDYDASYELTKKFIENGRKRFLFITDSESYSANKKREGFTQALTDSGISPENINFLHLPNDIAVVSDYLKEHPIDFDACYASEDGIAIGVLKYAQSKGKRVPEDVSVIGYNNSELCIAAEPEITSVDNRLKYICDGTVSRLLAVLSGEKEVEHRTSVACTLACRATTNFVTIHRPQVCES